MAGGAVAGLAHARVEAEVADQLARRGEAADVADRGHEGRRGLHVDAGDASSAAAPPARRAPAWRSRASSAAISASRKSTWRRQPSSVSRSSTGSSSPASQRRPPLPNASVTGGRSQRLRASTPCASFFARVRARTSRSRRLVSRRSARVRSSGVHTSSSRPEHQQPRQRPRVEPVGLRLRLGDRPQLARVGDHDPDPVRAAAATTILSAPVVASSATTSLGRQALREQLQRSAPASRSDPPTGPRRSRRSRPRRSRDAHPAQTRASRLLSSTMSGSAAGHTTTTDSCSQHTRVKSQGRPRTTSSSQLISQNGLPVRVSHQRPLSREHRCSRQGRTAVSCPDNGSCFKRRWAARARLPQLGIRHATHAALPAADQRQGRALHPHAARALGLRLHLRQRTERAAALPPALDSYNRFRRHRALGGLTPLQRVNNLSGTNS